jgi:hypothetical protein
MALPTCAICGHEIDTAAAACPKCGQTSWNGVPNPVPPPEVSGWALHKTPPELLELAKRTCTEEEFAAALREIELTGGLELKDFIHELEEGAPARD